MSKLIGVPLLAMVLLAFVPTSLASGEGHSGHSRKLMAPKKKPFPFAQCLKAGSGSPYVLSGPAPTTFNGAMNITLTIIKNPQADTSSACVQGMTDNLRKIEIRSGALCINSVSAVYVNGWPKTKGIKWTPIAGQDDAVLSLSGLEFKAGVLGSTITLIVGGACNTKETFAGPRHDGKFVYFMTNSSNVKCCPINSWDWGKSYSQDGPTPGGGSTLSIATALDTESYKASDLMDDNTSPLSSRLQIPAVNALLKAAGVTDTKSFAVTPDTQGTGIGADTTYAFTGDASAETAGKYLVKDGFSDYIKAAKIPCGSVITVSTGTDLIGAYACKRSRGQKTLKLLCLSPVDQVCWTPGAPIDFPPVQEFSAEVSEGSTEFSTVQEGSTIEGSSEFSSVQETSQELSNFGQQEGSSEASSEFSNVQESSTTGGEESSSA